MGRRPGALKRKPSLAASEMRLSMDQLLKKRRLDSVDSTPNLSRRCRRASGEFLARVAAFPRTGSHRGPKGGAPSGFTSTEPTTQGACVRWLFFACVFTISRFGEFRLTSPNRRRGSPWLASPMREWELLYVKMGTHGKFRHRHRVDTRKTS